MKHTMIVLLSLCFLLPSGCIVQDIHDQIANSNTELATINRTIEQLERTNTLLTSIEGNLSSIDTKLESIDRNLGSVDERMSTLQVVLDAVSEHLASLRRTINNIDSTIPFLRLSGDSEGEDGEEQSGSEQPAILIVPEDAIKEVPAEPEPAGSTQEKPKEKPAGASGDPPGNSGGPDR